MKISPEFRRNLWLEITPYRLMGMPLVLGAVFYLAYVSDDYRLGAALSSTSAGLFFLMSLIWGTKQASESIMNEIRDHTWDSQRMSVITPWQLTWGKLFGSTVYSWYGALICLFVYGLSSDKAPADTLNSMLVLLCAGVLAHAVSLLASLMTIQKERKFNKSQTAGILMLGIAISGPFFSMALDRGTSGATWYGIRFAHGHLLLGSLAAYAAWSVVGVYQLVRRELQMKNSPWAWAGFVLFAMLHVGGFFHSSTTLGGPALAAVSPAHLSAFFVALTTVYFMAFAERKDPIALQGLLKRGAAGQWSRFLERAPRWLLTMVIAAVSGMVVVATAAPGSSGSMAGTVWFVAACLLFMVRDMGLMLFFNLAASTRRADLLTILCLALLYGIFPATLAAMKMEQATLLFWPRADLNPLVGCLAALMEATAMACLVTMRWKKRVIQ